MKNFFNTSKIFYSWVHRLLLYIAFPLLALGASLAFSRMTASYIAFLLVVVLLPVAELIADFFVFNGCFRANAPTRLLLSSPNGRNVMINGLIFDQVRRFVELTVLTLIAYFATGYYKESLNADIFSAVAVLVLINYASITLFLLLLRYIDMFFGYLLVASIIVSIPIILCTVFIFSLVTGTVFIPFWLIPLLAASVGGTIAVIELLINAFDKTYGRK